MSHPQDETPLRRTPLYGLHEELGGRLVPFAGWSLPVQYPPGILAEHRQCRDSAALFDVSHMGQFSLHGPDAAAALERVAIGDLTGLRAGRQRYSMFTNEAGGIIDDLMVARLGEVLHLVVNAGRADIDFAHLQSSLPHGIELRRHDNRALLALQGPQAVTALARICPAAAQMSFMDFAALDIAGIPCLVSRSGYTGEDGFEISVPGEVAETLARRLLAEPEVAPAGLGARDSLRLEAGLPLWGQDIDELTTPVEAGMTWALGKRRRMAWDFPGAVAIRDHLDNGAPRRLVGLIPEGRAPVRAGTTLIAADGTAAGTVTSGTFSPTRDAPIALVYVRRDLAADGTALQAVLRGKPVPARIVPLPFVPHRYAR